MEKRSSPPDSIQGCIELWSDASSFPSVGLVDRYNEDFMHQITAEQLKRWEAGEVSRPQKWEHILGLLCILRDHLPVPSAMTDEDANAALVHVSRKPSIEEIRRLAQEGDLTTKQIQIFSRWEGKDHSADSGRFGPGLRLLGIESPRFGDDGGCVLVLPVFSIPPTLRASISSSDELDVRALADVRNDLHVRHDVLLANDLTHAMVHSGLRPPVVVTDVEFCRQHELLGSQPLHFPGIDGQVTSVVAIGLFSNKATLKMAAAGDLPFEIDDRGARNVRALVKPGSNLAQLVAEMPPGDEYDSEFRSLRLEDRGIVARSCFRDLNVAVVGGMTALGTARLGDFLTRNSKCWTSHRHEPLINLMSTQRPNDKFLSVIETPADRRGWSPTCNIEISSEPPSENLRVFGTTQH